MDAITEEVKNVVDELKKRTLNGVTPKMLEDVSLFYRFAKARDFNLVETEVMLRKHIAWRKEMQIDTILTDYKPPEVLVKYTPSTVVCFDKEGSIVRLLDGGRTDAKGLFNMATKKELAKYMSYLNEQDKDMMIKKGGNLGKPMYTAIYDFADLTYATAVSMKTLQYAPYLSKTFLDNYPEAIKCILIINVPFYFAWIYSVIKPLIPKSTFPKMGIYGKDGWKEELLKLIDAADLPAYLGGTKTDPDGNPLCETFILRGRPIPRSYFVDKESKKLSLASDAEKLTVKPFSKEELTFEVKEVNSFLDWEFETKNRDIDFSLLFKEESSTDFEPVEIIPRKRITSSDGPERGRFNCKNAGIYVIVFDNSYSWFHSKEVYYRAHIKSLKSEKTYISTL